MASLYSSSCLIRHTVYTHKSLLARSPRANQVRHLTRSTGGAAAPLATRRTLRTLAATAHPALAREHQQEQLFDLVREASAADLSIFDATCLFDRLGRPRKMDLPQPHTHIPLGGEMYVTSETDDSKAYRIHQSVVLFLRLGFDGRRPVHAQRLMPGFFSTTGSFDVDAYSCDCMAWTLTKGRPKEDRSCKHLRQVLGDE